MYLDALTLAALAADFHSLLVGGRVQAVVPTDPLTLVFEVYKGQRRHLLISADPQTARVHLTEMKGRRGVERETPFLLMLRKYVKGSRVTGVTVPAWERILYLDFEGAEGRVRLVAELMGRLSNIILIDDEGLIRDSARRITPEMTRARIVLPRQPYVPPPPIQRPAPDEVDQLELEVLLAGAPADRPLGRVLTGGLRGLSQLVAREMVFRAFGDAEATVGEVEALKPVLTALREVVAEARSRWTGADAQGWVVKEDDAVVAFAPYRLTHLPNAEPTDNLSEAIEAFFTAQTGRDAYAAARGRVRAAIEEARERARRQQAALDREVQTPDELERKREWGDWILAYAATLPPGADRLGIEDTGAGPLTIPLDPTLTPVQNAQKLFRDYERAKRAAGELADRQAAVALSLAALDQLLTDLDLAETRPEIDAVQAQFQALQSGKRDDKQPAGSGSRLVKPGRAPGIGGPHEVRSPDSFTILVGRNSRQNDHLTFERAAGHDLWLHVRGAPGAHVIIKTEGRAVPETTVKAAAELAAYYSASRGSTSVAVDVTEARRVRRMKGGAPGLVTYSGERTLHAEPRSADELETNTY